MPPMTRKTGPIMIPAANIAMPSDSTSGATVGSGISTAPGGGSCFVLCGSVAILRTPDAAADDVNDRKHHDPDNVNKVPVPRHHLHGRLVLLSHLALHSQSQDDRHDNHPAGHVHAVEA